MALSRSGGQRLPSIALGLIVLSSLLTLKTLVSAQGEGRGDLTDSRLNTTELTDCTCLSAEQASLPSNVSADRPLYSNSVHYHG